MRRIHSRIAVAGIVVQYAVNVAILLKIPLLRVGLANRMDEGNQMAESRM